MKDQVERFLQTKKSRRFVLKSGLYLSGGLILPELSGFSQLPTPVLPPPKPPWVEPTDLDQILSIAAREMGLSEEHVYRIVDCESRFDPYNINLTSGARGLWQIMPHHAPKFTSREWDYWRDWPNPYRNTMVAIDVYHQEGLTAWRCQ
jgi:hypothetical protein